MSSVKTRAFWAYVRERQLRDPVEPLIVRLERQYEQRRALWERLRQPAAGIKSANVVYLSDYRVRTNR